MKMWPPQTAAARNAPEYSLYRRGMKIDQLSANKSLHLGNGARQGWPILGYCWLELQPFYCSGRNTDGVVIFFTQNGNSKSSHYSLITVRAACLWPCTYTRCYSVKVMLFGCNTGADLHVHKDNLVDIRWLIKNATYDPHCFMCLNRSTGSLEFHFFDDPPSNDSDGWWNYICLLNTTKCHSC